MVPQSRDLGHREDLQKGHGKRERQEDGRHQRGREQWVPSLGAQLFLYRPLFQSPSWETALVPLSLRVEGVTLLNRVTSWAGDLPQVSPARFFGWDVGPGFQQSWPVFRTMESTRRAKRGPQRPPHFRWGQDWTTYLRVLQTLY